MGALLPTMAVSRPSVIRRLGQASGSASMAGVMADMCATLYRRGKIPDQAPASTTFDGLVVGKARSRVTPAESRFGTPWCQPVGRSFGLPLPRAWITAAGELALARQWRSRAQTPPADCPAIQARGAAPA